MTPEEKAQRIISATPTSERNEDGPNFDNRGRPDRAVSRSDMVAVDAPRLESVLTRDIDDVVERLRDDYSMNWKEGEPHTVIYTYETERHEAADLLIAMRDREKDLDDSLTHFKVAYHKVNDELTALKAENERLLERDQYCDEAFRYYEATLDECHAEIARLREALEEIEQLKDQVVEAETFEEIRAVGEACADGLLADCKRELAALKAKLERAREALASIGPGGVFRSQVDRISAILNERE